MSDAQRRPRPVRDAASLRCRAGHWRRRSCRGYGLSGCGDDGNTRSSGGGGGGAEKASGTVSLARTTRTNVPKGACTTVLDAFARPTNVTIALDTVDHNTFQEKHQRPICRHARRRVHLVRGLPDAVFRRPGAARPHRRRLGNGSQRHHVRGLQAGLDRAGRSALLRAVELLLLGYPLPQERVGEERLRAAGTLDDFKALARRSRPTG